MNISLVGKGLGWEKAPKEGEVWGVNDLIMRRPLSKLFHMHDLDKTEYELREGQEVNEVLRLKVREDSVPIYSVKKYPGLPTSIRYPIEGVVKYFGVDYFNSCIDYMVAYAIMKIDKLAFSLPSIDLYGICMRPASHWIHQKAGVEFWIGVANGMGIEVNIHGPKSELLRTKNRKLYGFNIMQGDLL